MAVTIKLFSVGCDFPVRTFACILLSLLVIAGCTRKPTLEKPTVNQNVNNTWTSDSLDSGEIDMVKQRVLADRQYVHERDCHGDTPLMTVIGYENLPLVELLLENGADPNVPADDGYSCLLFAIDSDSPESIAITDILVRSGADIHETGTNGWTPLHMAAARGYVEKAQLLIRAGARVNQRKRIDAAETPLMEAAFSGQPGTVRLLLKHGADPTMRDMINERTPLEIAQSAIAGTDPEVYEYLKAENIQIDADEMFAEMDLPPEQLAIMKQTIGTLDLAENYVKNSKRLVETGNHGEVIRILTEHVGHR